MRPPSKVAPATVAELPQATRGGRREKPKSLGSSPTGDVRRKSGAHGRRRTGTHKCPRWEPLVVRPTRDAVGYPRRGGGKEVTVMREGAASPAEDGSAMPPGCRFWLAPPSCRGPGGKSKCTTPSTLIPLGAVSPILPGAGRAVVVHHTVGPHSARAVCPIPRGLGGWSSRTTARKRNAPRLRSLHHHRTRPHPRRSQPPARSSPRNRPLLMERGSTWITTR